MIALARLNASSLQMGISDKKVLCSLKQNVVSSNVVQRNGRKERTQPATGETPADRFLQDDSPHPLKTLLVKRRKRAIVLIDPEPDLPLCFRHPRPQRQPVRASRAPSVCRKLTRSCRVSRPSRTLRRAGMPNARIMRQSILCVRTIESRAQIAQARKMASNWPRAHPAEHGTVAQQDRQNRATVAPPDR
jgi:hypothetical protein